VSVSGRLLRFSVFLWAALTRSLCVVPHVDISSGSFTTVVSSVVRVSVSGRLLRFSVFLWAALTLSLCVVPHVERSRPEHRFNQMRKADGRLVRGMSYV
jgi:hypothetical protein